MDYLAGAKYGREILKTHPEGFAAGFFAVTFGDAFPVIDKLLATGKCPLVRINLLWEDSHTYGNKNVKQMRKLARKCQALATKYPSVDVRIAPFTEHNLSSPDKYLDICQLEAPSCLIINSVWKGSLSKKYINEVHGDHKKPTGRYQYSFDGTEATNKNVKLYLETHAGAEVFFMWSNRHNLRYSEKDTTARPQRIKEANVRKPSADYLRSISYLFTEEGAVRVPPNWLIKSHAERHGPVDAKGDKLLIISPIRAAAITLKRGGNTIAKLNYYGPFEDGRSRYYATQFGFKYGKNLDVCIDGEKHGTINGGFRAGSFR